MTLPRKDCPVSKLRLQNGGLQTRIESGRSCNRVKPQGFEQDSGIFLMSKIKRWHRQSL